MDTVDVVAEIGPAPKRRVSLARLLLLDVFEGLPFVACEDGLKTVWQSRHRPRHACGGGVGDVKDQRVWVRGFDQLP